LDEKEEKKLFEIFVNGTKKKWGEMEISFSQVVNLAFDGNPPNAPGEMFSVTYSRGGNEKNPQGSLTDGESVKTKDGMRFDVSATDKS
jgi:hypothetical protein